jgi:hypothetical protein
MLDACATVVNRQPSGRDCLALKIDLKYFPSTCFLLKGYKLGPRTWGSLIFSSYICTDERRVERCGGLQEKVSKPTGYFEAAIFGVLGIISTCFFLRAAWFGFFVMLMLIIFTGLRLKQVSAACLIAGERSFSE